MKYIILLVLVIASGCSTPNPSAKATQAAYEQVKPGMSRQQVYALLGQPRSVRPEGDIDHCHTAVWGIPHGSHGWGHWTIEFSGDTVTGVTGVSNGFDAHVSASASL
ncbi:MAG TPA: outer membrane protein assembly factor BamE [Verrucomicrobiae bacterium]|jgi:hypothetical protein|nr:outer membrane protein assembly factor BamE [Verrucomicrobiae bacterium]